MQTWTGANQVILIPQGSTQPGIQQCVFQSTPAQQCVIHAPGGMAVAPPPYTDSTVEPEDTQPLMLQPGYYSTSDNNIILLHP